MNRMALAFLTGLLVFAPQAFAAGCEGVFKRDSSGVLPSEGGMEPTGDKRKSGQKGHFTGYDISEGGRYFELDGGSQFPAKNIALAKGCPLKRLKYGRLN